jgi:hypothetical protein
MSRAPKITLRDVMPTHLRMASDTPVSVSIPVGSTVADARRQLVLRTFASTGGDVSRTAKILGLVEADVRGELLALVGGGPEASHGAAGAAVHNGAGESDKRAARRADTPATPARAQAKGKAGKKAR